jgi:hypothetical protein
MFSVSSWEVETNAGESSAANRSSQHKHWPLQLLSPEIGTTSIDWAQLSGFYLKMETESSLQNVMSWKINRTAFLDKDRMMDNVQTHYICTNVLSQTFQPYTERKLNSGKWP